MIWDAYQFADHADRYRVGEALPQIDGDTGPDRRQLVQHGDGDRFDPWAHRRCPAVGERRRDELAQSSMLGPIGGEHIVDGDPRAQRPIPGDLPFPERRPMPARVLGYAGVGQQAAQHGGVGHRPRGHAAGQHDPGDRSVPADPGQFGVDVGAAGVENDRFVSRAQRGPPRPKDSADNAPRAPVASATPKQARPRKIPSS